MFRSPGKYKNDEDYLTELARARVMPTEEGKREQTSTTQVTTSSLAMEECKREQTSTTLDIPDTTRHFGRCTPDFGGHAEQQILKALDSEVPFDVIAPVCEAQGRSSTPPLKGKGNKGLLTCVDTKTEFAAAVPISGWGESRAD